MAQAALKLGTYRKLDPTRWRSSSSSIIQAAARESEWRWIGTARLPGW